MSYEIDDDDYELDDEEIEALALTVEDFQNMIEHGEPVRLIHRSARKVPATITRNGVADDRYVSNTAGTVFTRGNVVLMFPSKVGSAH